MPNRIIKESICTSDNLNMLTPEQEVFFYRLMVNCDDFGRMDARPQILLAKCFPLRLHQVSVNDIECYLQALEEQELIILYEVENKPFLQITTWDKHQQKRAKHSKYPAPPSNDSNSTDMISSDINCNHTQSNVPEKRESRNENTRNENTRNDNEKRQRETENEIEFDVSKLESGHCRDLITSFEKEFGRPLSPFEIETLRSWLDDFSDELILYALKEAVLGQNRSFRYIQGILTRWKGEGVKCVQDVEEREKIFQAKKRSRAAPLRVADNAQVLEAVFSE